MDAGQRRETRPPPPPHSLADVPPLSRTQKHNRRRRRGRAAGRVGTGPEAAAHESTDDPLLVPSTRRPTSPGGVMPRSPHSGAAAAVATAEGGGGGDAAAQPPPAKKSRAGGAGGVASALTDSALSCGTGGEGNGRQAQPAGAADGGGGGGGGSTATLTAEHGHGRAGGALPAHRRPCRADMSAVITAALRTGRHAAAAVVSEGRGAGPAPGAPAPPGPPPAAPGPPAGAPTAKAAAKRAARAAARPALDGNYARYYGYRLALGGRAAPVPPPRSEPVDARVAALAGPAGRDPRLAALDLRSLLRGRAVLDVGCNAGLIPLALAVLGKPASVLGVDVDACLIRDAVRHLSTARSAAATLAADARAPGRARSAGEDAGRALRRVTFRREDVVASASAAAPGAGAAAAAPVAAPPAGGAGRGNDTLPHPPPPPPAHPPAGYGAVFCLSVTKWVHVRGGDGALAAFLARLAALTAPGGHLILEPQPWSSYEAAARKKLAGPRVGGPPLSELALRPDGFADHLEAAHGLKLVARRVPSGVARGFARELLVFKKPAAVAV